MLYMFFYVAMDLDKTALEELAKAAVLDKRDPLPSIYKVHEYMCVYTHGVPVHVVCVVYMFFVCSY